MYYINSMLITGEIVYSGLQMRLLIKLPGRFLETEHWLEDTRPSPTSPPVTELRLGPKPL